MVGLEEVGVLDEVGWLTVKGRVGGDCIMCLKRVEWKNGADKQKNCEREGGMWVRGGCLKNGGVMTPSWTVVLVLQNSI